MKKILQFLLFIFFAYSIHAQKNLSFYVSNQLNEPIEGASVSVGTQTLLTNANGIAYIEAVQVDPLNQIPYSITQSGYRTVYDTVFVSQYPNQTTIEVPVVLTGKYRFSVFTYDENDTVSGVSVNANSIVKTTDLSGNVSFSGIIPGKAVGYSAYKTGYQSVTGALNSVISDTSVSIKLRQLYLVQDLNYTLSYKSLKGATNYEITFINQRNPDSVITILRNSLPYGTGTSTSLSLLSINDINYNTVYTVQVRALVGGIWQNTHTEFVIEIGDIPQTVILGGNGFIETYNLFFDVVYSKVSGADNYIIQIENFDGSFSYTTTRDNMPYGTGTSTSFNLSWIKGLIYLDYYYIKIIPIVNGKTPKTRTRSTEIFVSDAFTTLISDDCQKYIETLNTKLSFDPLFGVTDYEITLTNSIGGQKQSLLRSSMPSGTPTSTYFYLNWFNVTLGQTYYVSITGLKDGQLLVSGFDPISRPSCPVTITSSVPSTGLTSTFCGATLTSMNTYVSYIPVSGATNYEIQISSFDQTFDTTILRSEFTSGTATSTAFYPIWIQGLNFNVTYNVSVAAEVDGLWGQHSEGCTLTMESNIPTTKVIDANCGMNVYNKNTYVYYNDVLGATNFRFRFTPSNGGNAFTLLRSSMPYGTGNSTKFNTWWISQLSAGVSYSIEVSAQVAGTWGPWGQACSINIVSLLKSDVEPDFESEEEFSEVLVYSLEAYPNPFNESFTVRITSQDNIKAQLYIIGMTGKVIINQEIAANSDFNFGAELESGTYILNIIDQAGRTYTEPIVKK